MRALALFVCVAALAAVGCGGGETEKERYIDEYKPLHDRLIKVSQEIGRSLEGSQEGDALGVRFNVQIAALDNLNRQIRSLETPAELRDESRELTQRIDATVAKLKEISTAVQEGKPGRAASATVELAALARAVNTAQNRLSRATGAEVR